MGSGYVISEEEHELEPIAMKVVKIKEGAAGGAEVTLGNLIWRKFFNFTYWTDDPPKLRDVMTVTIQGAAPPEPLAQPPRPNETTTFTATPAEDPGRAEREAVRLLRETRSRISTPQSLIELIDTFLARYDGPSPEQAIQDLRSVINGTYRTEAWRPACPECKSSMAPYEDGWVCDRNASHRLITPIWDAETLDQDEERE